MVEKTSLVSLYLHYPFCRHLCNYCDFHKKVPGGRRDADDYEGYLRESFKIHGELMEEHGYGWKPLETLYVGGGTPSLWGLRGARLLEDLFREHGIRAAGEREWTLEVNPKAWSEEGLEAFGRAGFTRFSLGVQSLDPRYLELLDRFHDEDDVREALGYFRREGLRFSADLMLGLPRSEGRDLLGELKALLDYGPEHLSLYILTVKKNYRHYGDLPDDGALEEEYLRASGFLREHGFVHYEVSNFAKPGAESGHNLRYWRSRSVAALGPSAVGFFAEKALRYRWKPGRAEEPEVETLTPAQVKMERAYLGLRTSDGLDGNFFGEGCPLPVRWRTRGYLLPADGRVVLAPKGYLRIDSLMDEMFAAGVL